MSRRSLRAVVIIVLCLLPLAACSGTPPPKPPPPPVAPAPEALRSLVVYVHQMQHPPESDLDKWDYNHTPGLTEGLRNAFERQLTRAGYRAVVGRRGPHDLMAVVHANWPYDHPGVASLTLMAGNDAVEQLSVEIPLANDRKYDRFLEEHAAVALVEAMGRSSALVTFATGPRTPKCECGAPDTRLRIAGPETAPAMSSSAAVATPPAGSGLPLRGLP